MQEEIESEDESEYSGSEEPKNDEKLKTKGHWTPEEDSLLQDAVQKYEAKNWKKIAEDLNGRTGVS